MMPASIGHEQWYAFVNTLRQAKLSQRTVEYACGTLRRIAQGTRFCQRQGSHQNGRQWLRLKKR